MPSPLLRQSKGGRRSGKDTPKQVTPKSTPVQSKLKLKAALNPGLVSESTKPEKLKVKSAQDVDSDENVEEYHFDNVDGGALDDMDEDMDTFDEVGSVITVSSDPPDDAEFTLSHRPWLHFSVQQRFEWEQMYANVATMPMDGSWEVTEDYQRERDLEMLRYMEDHPTATWVIPTQQADQAYFHLLERTRWRSLGIRIYGRETVPDWFPGTVGGDRMQQMPPLPQFQDPRGYHMPPPGPMPMMPPPPPPPLPPVNFLPSQPHAQPIPVQHPTHIGRPANPPSHGNSVPLPFARTTAVNPGLESGRPVPGTSKQRKPREKKEPAPAMSPSLPPPTPPYPDFKKPAEPYVPNKPGRKSIRKPADFEGFPWTRKMDFRDGKEKALWDDSIYDEATIAQMEATRTRNMPIIGEIDARIIEQQRESMRLARAAKRRAAAMAPGDQPDTSEVEFSRRKGGRKKDGSKLKLEGSGATDPYHSGQFCFVAPEEEAKANSLGLHTPDQIIDETEAGNVPLERSGDIKICWNPGKRALAENLEQAVFTVRDTVLTRRQLANTPILTRRAAERIIDFCPDMLWRNMLLRIASEAGYGNKEVRDRFCWNGCYCDKATITKRISAALGQKQTQAKSKGYGPGEMEWYNHNVKCFSQYIDFFGKRTGHRNWTKILSNPADDRKTGSGEEGSSKANDTGEGDDDSGDDDDDDDDDPAVDLLNLSRGNQDAGDELDIESSAEETNKITLEDEDEELDEDGEDNSDNQVTSIPDSDAANGMDEGDG